MGLPLNCPEEKILCVPRESPALIGEGSSEGLMRAQGAVKVHKVFYGRAFRVIGFRVESLNPQP